MTEQRRLRVVSTQATVQSGGWPRDLEAGPGSVVEGSPHPSLPFYVVLVNTGAGNVPRLIAEEDLEELDYAADLP